MSDGIGLAEVLLGLPGFRVLDVVEADAEVVDHGRDDGDDGALSDVRGARASRRIGCRSTSAIWPASGGRHGWCGEAAVAVPGAAVFGADLDRGESEHVDAQAVLTRRAGVEACRQVGENARPVAQLADELGVCWWTIMNAVIEHGTPLVDDPERIGTVRQLGVDETSFLAANRDHATVYATGLVDLERHVVIDMVEGNSAADLRRWTTNADPAWLAGIEVVATDLAESFRAGLSPGLAHARRVADPFHVVRVGNRCVDTGPPAGAERDARPPWPQGRSALSDPQAAAHRLRTARRTRRGADAARAARRRPPRRGARRLAGQGVRPRRLPRRHPSRRSDAARQGHRRLLDRRGARGPVARQRPSPSWRTEILAHHDTGASNGPTEGLNLCVKKVKRCGHGFRTWRALPATRAAPRRRHHLARTTPTATHPNPLSPLRRVEPVIRPSSPKAGGRARGRS